MKNLLLILFTLLCCTQSVPAENNPYRSDHLWLTVPDHADWLYRTGEKAKVEVSFCLYGIPQDVEVTYEIGPDMMPATSSGKVMLKRGRATIDMGTMKKPGFLDLRLTAKVGDKKYQHHVKVGFSPEQLKPYTKNPSDFDAFWQSNLEAARKAVKNEKILVKSEKVDKYTTDEFDCYLLKLWVDNRHSVYGYLTKPKAEGKYPVVLCPPGAGIKTINEPMRNSFYAKNGFIRLEMEIHGLNPEMTDVQFKEIASAFDYENGYLTNGLDDKDNYYMKHVYVACVRAIDYLTSLPEWDGKNVFVQGGSQGGALSLITAGLDPRVTACVANHPALSDMAGYLDNRAGGYPHFNRLNKMLTPEKVRTMSYYDVVNFARRITCPVYLTWGYNDNVCPPTTSYIVWNLITAPKESLITPINEHWTSEATNHRQMEWLKTCVDRQLPLLADGVIDTTNHETAGLKPAKDVKTVTIFRAGDDTDHYSNGVVMTSFKGKLYCMWQSSPKDEDSDDTWVAYSVSADDGQTWSKPQPLALPTKDCYCTSGGWLVRGDTLIAFIDTWQKGLDPRGGKTNYMTSTDGYTWSQMQAVTMADGSVMEGVLEQDPYTLPGGRIVGAAHFMAGLHICPVYTDDPKGIAGWRKALFESEDMGKQSREIEPSQYVQPDGTLVMLFRDQRSSFRKLVSVSSDRGETWTKPALTNIPDGRTKQCAGNLPNGTSFMVSCSANEKRRWPLVLQLSLDGSTFDKAVLLRSGSVNDLPPKRYEGRYKTVGYNYPKAMVWQDKLFVCYSTNKEDVECTVIPLNMKLNY